MRFEMLLAAVLGSWLFLRTCGICCRNSFCHFTSQVICTVPIIMNEIPAVLSVEGCEKLAVSFHPFASYLVTFSKIHELLNCVIMYA